MVDSFVMTSATKRTIALLQLRLYDKCIYVFS